MSAKPNTPDRPDDRRDAAILLTPAAEIIRAVERLGDRKPREGEIRLALDQARSIGDL